MTVYQQELEVGEFARYLRDLAARLDPGRGWYGVFVRRDPAGMRSCLDGVEVPPWDVVESLLADLAALHGARFAEQVSVRAAALYSASAAAHDRRPGGRQELVHRLELMIGEQGRAAQRLRDAGADDTDPADPEALAWARDDHARASARCAELRKRLAAVTVPDAYAEPAPALDTQPAPAPAPGRPGVTPDADVSGPEGPAVGHPRVAADAYSSAPEAPAPTAYPAPAPDAPAPGRPRVAPAVPVAPAAEPSRKKPRGARFAGLEVDDEATGYAPSPVPVLPAPARPGAFAPRGARFGGAGDEGGGDREGRDRAGRDRTPDALPDPAAGQAVAAAVARLVRLRTEGRSGEAHVVLCEVAAWPAARLPVLAVALYRAGLSADWTTLLWEVSSLPPAGFASAAGALAAAGHDDDCGLLLRQGVARPAAEVAAAALALDGAGHEREARDLLGAFIRVRTPQEAAALAGSGDTRLLPLLLAAAREVSAEREWDLVHALRVAGVPGV
ncbi:hypothetical protein CIB93_07590 [Streptomyces sp. WZ.A104]|uniref:hypothetical protein n=1 Tax=Streptomyces sp. WZ.A104 TaxID=2023771 RepID=UPI000BBBB791|nr:hypothetical protein [Streptomyces sp. WZ.A104]PCG86583.1 hypothetical protein CIB93_07590 [Streptomyces sp. WZ.A104]